MKIVMYNAKPTDPPATCFYSKKPISYTDAKVKYILEGSGGLHVSQEEATRRGFTVSKDFIFPDFTDKGQVSDYLRDTLKMRQIHPDYLTLYRQLSEHLEALPSSNGLSSYYKPEVSGKVDFGRRVKDPEEDKGTIKIETDPSGEQRKYRVYKSGHRTLIGETLPRPYRRTNPTTGQPELVTPRWNDNGDIVEVVESSN